SVSATPSALHPQCLPAPASFRPPPCPIACCVYAGGGGVGVNKRLIFPILSFSMSLKSSGIKIVPFLGRMRVVRGLGVRVSADGNRSGGGEGLGEGAVEDVEGVDAGDEGPEG